MKRSGPLSRPPLASIHPSSCNNASAGVVILAERGQGRLWITHEICQESGASGTKLKLALGARYAGLLSNARSGARCDTVNCFCWL